MTYEEIKRRLTSCENKLKQLKDQSNPAHQSKNYNTAVEKLTILKESLKRQLKEADKGIIYTDDEKKAKDLSDKGSNVKLTVKEQDGVAFSIDETKAIATKVGKAVAMSLKSLGDQVTSMKAKHIEENSFEIYVQYKNGADDQFSFYVSGDTLHLVDFSFDKELVDVGVKPSGEAIVNVDVLANELVKHFKSTNEGMSDQEWADAKEKERLDKHPEKDIIRKIQNLVAKEKANKLKEVTKEGEGDDHHYIKVSRRDYKKVMSILNNAAEPSFVKMDVVDDDGAGNVIIYFMFNEFADDFDVEDREAFMYDAVMDLQAQGIDITDHSAELDEAAEGDVDGGDLDIGHQDDEPDMLMKDIYDIATYAAKLHKMLKKYNQFDGEVDFPHWWQKKVTLARDYISAAQHYLEAEEKQPALDQLALESQSHPVMVQQRIAHAKKAKEKKTVKEDWGGSDQRAMNQQIHKALGEPTKMPSPFDDKLEYAVQDAVDFHWDDWPEYQQDREGLYTQAKRAYLRAMFRDTFDKMVRMFEPADEATKGQEDKFHKKLDTLVHNTFGKRKEEMNEASYDDAIAELRNVVDQAVDLGEEAREIVRQYFRDELSRLDSYGAFDLVYSNNRYDVTLGRFVDRLEEEGYDGDSDDEDDMDEGVAKTKKAYDLVITKMKELAKQYKAGDTSVIGQLKDLTAKKKQLEKMLDKDVSSLNRNQELTEGRGDLETIISIIQDRASDSGFSEEEEAEEVIDAIKDHYGLEEEVVAEGKATCCGKCGRVHVKGTECKKPYLKGKDHCRYN